MPRRLGILGGTFNPPHLGHLAVARCARAQLGLERVALMPAHTPPHKTVRGELAATPAQRLAMCELAVAQQPGLCACALEIERGGASYTVDTLLALHALRPDIELTLILGSDTARTLPSWHAPTRILQLARVAVAERAGDGRAQVLAAIDSLRTDAGAAVDFLAMPSVDVSSSQVRERAAHGGSLDGLVGPVVAAYISEQRLYRAVAGNAGRCAGALAQ